MATLSERPVSSLRQALAALARTGLLPAAGAPLEATMAGAGAALQQAVLAETPAFSASGNPQILPDLKRHAREHLDEILRLFGDGALEDFAFVRAHARLRAEQRFPLEASLHAYRCGHRVLSRWMRDAAIATRPADVEKAIAAVADFAIEYTDAISTMMTSEYVAHTRLIAEAEQDLRSETLGVLMSGYDESDVRAAQLLRRAGYLDQRQSYCVAVAQSVNAAEMENPPRAQRIVAALSEAVSRTQIRALGGVRDNLAVAVFSDRRRLSGWTAADADLAARAQAAMIEVGPAVVIGVSAAHPSTSFVPRALNEAKVALDFAGPTRRVVGFRDLPVRGLLVHRAADYVQSAPPAWIAPLIEGDAKSQGALVKTLRALADADLNLQMAARALGKHPNTLYARIARIRELTGLAPQRFADLSELLLAVDCWRL